MTPQRLAERRYAQTPKGCYTRHKANAKRRGVAFLLSFDEWWDIWQQSGKWSRRGNRKGYYVMMRRGDEGPYAVGNVHIGRFVANVVERNRMVAIKRHSARSTTVTWADHVS